MVLARSVQDVQDLVRVVVGELLVHGSNVGVHSPVDGQEGEEDDGLLVDDIELVADSRDGETGAGAQDSDLGGNAVAGKLVEDGLSGLFRLLLWDRGLFEARGGGSEGGGERGRGGADREGRASAGGA